MSDPVLLSFGDERCLDVAVAGGKGASLAAMTAAGLPVPPGFVVPAGALEQAIDRERLLAAARAGDHEAAAAVVRAVEPPRVAIEEAYDELGGGAVAVRSSACAEDSEAASYAGQQETYLNVEGADEVCARIVECWASFFSERALFYRGQKGSLDDLRMAVVVQRMVDPEKSGVVFTADPVQCRRDRMVIEAIFGLGEQVVSGEATPDHYVVDRAGDVVRERLVNGGVLSVDELARLAGLGRQLEERFGCPQDIEWAIAGGELYLLQSRPVTTL
ncbi:MAG TPA: PEP/pyruvate-binding domain-containing protein [Gaiellaceae bacterium]|nr:PEP/pyruvate-binding domain-containing protein [Gaiellaceae bacterium]